MDTYIEINSMSELEVVDIPMPSEEEAVIVLGKKETKKRNKEEEAKYQHDHYKKNKAFKLAYKQAERGITRVPSNRCYLHTHYLPKYIHEPKKKPRRNLDHMNYGGMTRSLTITQPTDAILALLKTHIPNGWEETEDGVKELDVDIPTENTLQGSAPQTEP